MRRRLTNDGSASSPCLASGILAAFNIFCMCAAFARWFPAAEDWPSGGKLARLGDRAELADLAKQVAAGNFLRIPFLFLPCFYLTQEVTTHGMAATRRRPQLRASAATYGPIPSRRGPSGYPAIVYFWRYHWYLRLPINHAMSFGYVCVLSLMRGRVGERSDD